MAKRKKRKVKRKKSKKKKVRRVKAKTKAMRKVKPVKKTNVAQSAYTLTMAGGIIVLIAGILSLFFSSLFSLIPIAGTIIVAALPNLVCGIVLLASAATIKKNPRSAGIIILVFSLIALVFRPHGFIVGPVLALIASIVLLVRK